MAKLFFGLSMQFNSETNKIELSIEYFIGLLEYKLKVLEDNPVKTWEYEHTKDSLETFKRLRDVL